MKQWKGPIKKTFVELPVDMHGAMKAYGNVEGKKVGDMYIAAASEFLENKWNDRKILSEGYESATTGTQPALNSTHPAPSVHDSAVTLSSTGPFAQPSHLEHNPRESGDESWVEMLRYILVHGDQDTRDAITRNLDRFHLLARMLNQEPVSHERGGEVPEPPADQQARMDRLRELGRRRGGSGKDPGINEDQVPRQTGTDPKRPRRGSKH